jgi:hypothetical protein
MKTLEAIAPYVFFGAVFFGAVIFGSAIAAVRAAYKRGWSEGYIYRARNGRPVLKPTNVAHGVRWPEPPESPSLN